MKTIEITISNSLYYYDLEDEKAVNYCIVNFLNTIDFKPGYHYKIAVGEYNSFMIDIEFTGEELEDDDDIDYAEGLKDKFVEFVKKFEEQQIGVDELFTEFCDYLRKNVAREDRKDAADTIDLFLAEKKVELGVDEYAELLAKVKEVYFYL